MLRTYGTGGRITTPSNVSVVPSLRNATSIGFSAIAIGTLRTRSASGRYLPANGTSAPCESKVPTSKA